MGDSETGVLDTSTLILLARLDPDALIAATALARSLPLYTCNPSDFDVIDGLDVRAVSPREVD